MIPLFTSAYLFHIQIEFTTKNGPKEGGTGRVNVGPGHTAGRSAVD